MGRPKKASPIASTDAAKQFAENQLFSARFSTVMKAVRDLSPEARDKKLLELQRGPAASEVERYQRDSGQLWITTARAAVRHNRGHAGAPTFPSESHLAPLRALRGQLAKAMDGLNDARAILGRRGSFSDEAISGSIVFLERQERWAALLEVAGFALAGVTAELPEDQRAADEEASWRTGFIAAVRRDFSTRAALRNLTLDPATWGAISVAVGAEPPSAKEGEWEKRRAAWKMALRRTLAEPSADTPSLTKAHRLANLTSK